MTGNRKKREKSTGKPVANPFPMEWDTELLSPAMQAVIRELDDNAATIVEDTCRACESFMPIYFNAETLASESPMRIMVERVVHTFHQALLDGISPLTSEHLALVSEHIRRRAQHVPLAELLRARQLCARVHWAALLHAVCSRPALYDEMLHRVSHNMLCYLDVHAQTGYQAYTNEERTRIRWRERLRNELFTVILTQPDDMAAFRSHALALMLDATAPHCVLALRLTTLEGLDWHVDDSVDHLVEAIAQAAGAVAENLLRAYYNGHLLIWLPLLRGQLTFDNDRQLGAIAATVAKAASEVSAIGVGLPGTGPRGWRQSAEQAMKAVDSGVRSALEGEIYLYSDIVLDDAVVRSENTLRYFESLLARLAAEPHLLQTLQAYFDRGQHRKKAAEALGIHPNTLDYRLERIQSVLGVELNNVGWIAKLQTALRLRGTVAEVPA